MDKPIRISKHASEQCIERGVKIDEIIEAIRNEPWETAKSNRLQCRQNFQYNDYWNETFYPIKQVMPVFVEEDKEIVVVTVYSYFF
jgi:hypothetical protein